MHVYSKKVYFSNKLKAYEYFSKVFDVSSSWFQKPIIGCDNIKDMGYICGSCENSEIIKDKVINFPCTFDINHNKEIKNKMNSFLFR